MVTFVLTKKPPDRFRLSCWNIKLSLLQWLTVSSDVRMRKRLTIRGGPLVLNVPSGVAVTALPARRFIKPATLFPGRTQQIVAREPRLRVSQEAFVIQPCRYRAAA